MKLILLPFMLLPMMVDTPTPEEPPLVEEPTSTEIVESSSSSEIVDSSSSSETGKLDEIIETGKTWIDQANEVLNQPLPIIGVSTLSILGILWFVLTKTSFGKKALKRLGERMTKSEEDIEKYKKDTTEYVDTLKAENEELKTELKEIKEYIITICENSRNLNIQKLKGDIENGEKGKETTNNDSKKA